MDFQSHQLLSLQTNMGGQTENILNTAYAQKQLKCSLTYRRDAQLTSVVLPCPLTSKLPTRRQCSRSAFQCWYGTPLANFSNTLRYLHRDIGNMNQDSAAEQTLSETDATFSLSSNDYSSQVQSFDQSKELGKLISAMSACMHTIKYCFNGSDER